MAVKLDVTDRKEAERQLELATEEAEKASRAKSIFLANMSHEIRTPLNAVLGFSQLMMDDAGLTPRQREHLASINVNGEHLLALINDVLAMSKIEAGRTTLQVNSVDLSGLLDDVERMFRLRAEEKRLAFEVQRSGALPRWVLADETKLRQILVNLLGNSMKFTRQGGIVVRARAVPSAESAFRLVVDVEDTGAGIAEEDLPRLFEHFEQARSGGPPAGGTGLGLAISRAFARQMGGEITVRSRPGVGSAFTLEVDLVAEEHEVEPLVTPSGRIRSLAKGVGPRRVLVVDDVEANRQVAALMLERVGFDVRTAGDGPGAISAFRAWKPHLVLMDLRMPGMDGLEAIRRIRSLDGGGMLPIIALTASAFEEDRREVLAAGGTDFVGKPFREPDLLRKVGDALGIRYDREETGPGESARSPETFPPIPESLRTELRTAVVRADLDQVRHLAAALEREAPLAAGMVRALADQFEYGKLLEAIDRSDAGG